MHIIQSSVGTSGFMARSWNLPHDAAFNTEMMLCRISPAGRSQSSREEIMPDPEIHITTERARAGATPISCGMCWAYRCCLRWSRWLSSSAIG